MTSLAARFGASFVVQKENGQMWPKTHKTVNRAVARIDEIQSRIEMDHRDILFSDPDGSCGYISHHMKLTSVVFGAIAKITVSCDHSDNIITWDVPASNLDKLPHFRPTE